MANGAKNEMTLPDCDPYLGRRKYGVSMYGTLCMEPAAEQNRLLFTTPTMKSWSTDAWFVWLSIALIIALCGIGCVFQSCRWYRRIKHRHEREERCKREDGMLRMISSMYRKRSQSASQQRAGVSPASHASYTCSEPLIVHDASDDAEVSE
ncbi:hypothetical_protein (plasmid) [Leishmania braziliensis MHOM/BR/75/M2904]|uniref:Hypothetical_protein n=1 Tax=Leishmania braziliensis MHOM/BR/75/M2904 TaxID=420245 RepID=A0A3P3Z117_LEIBR|nr:unnamed protein product [Leishmania braziliensis]CAJ2469312.1 unnamed protein product [Leishmania braziliensis]SYZ63931.1 hypothetical_protein [Leishmania braziliensis MHOM/BR/75/M2904]